jgi:bacterioferritin
MAGNSQAPNKSGEQVPKIVSGISDVATLRQRARSHLDEGAVTPSYPKDRESILKLLNEALATELVRVLRYKRH